MGEKSGFEKSIEDLKSDIGQDNEEEKIPSEELEELLSGSKKDRLRVMQVGQEYSKKAWLNREDNLENSNDLTLTFVDEDGYAFQVHELDIAGILGSALDKETIFSRLKMLFNEVGFNLVDAHDSSIREIERKIEQKNKSIIEGQSIDPERIHN